MNTFYINGKGTDGLIHAAHPTERFKTLCGWEPPLDQRWYTQSRDTPTCPKCVAMTEHDTDTAQAVIEAARALMKHVSCEILVSRVTYNTLLRVSIRIHDGEHVEFFAEAYSEDFPDTLFGQLAVLSAALEAHDEAAGEDA